MHGARSPKCVKLIPPRGIVVRRSTDVLAIHHGPTRRALQLLQENYRRRITPEETAASCGMTRRRLDQSFRQHLGRSFSAQHALLRLTRAKELLLDTPMTAADVAAETGFNTPQYFNECFREATGLTPRKFRLQHKATRQEA